MPDHPYLILDSHLDLGFSAIQVNRDLTQPAATVRIHDPEPIKRSFGSCTVTFPELRKGSVGIIFGTVMSRIDLNDQWTRTGMYVQSQCHGVGKGHYAFYKAMEREGVLRFIHTAQDLDEIVSAWKNPAPDTPIGLVLAMESADPILDPDQVPEWYDMGLRIVSISHYGTSSYCHGTGTEGGLLPRGKPLLDALKKAGIIVDLTHTTDQAFWEILDHYDGPVAASHHNCRSLTPGQRQLTDDMIQAIVERGGVIGAAFDAWMLDPEWKRQLPCYEQTTKATLGTVANHIDHVCQLAGNAHHAGIGTDLDGGFGQEQSPRDLNTVADLQNLVGILHDRGYKEEAVRNILSGNWIRLLKNTWT
jgi:membrane dipeptidase